MKSKFLFHLAVLPVLLFAGLVILPATLRAQEAVVAEVVIPVSGSVAAVETTLATPAVLAGPRLVQVGITRNVADVALVPSLRGPSQRNTSWMIVGGAMLLVGLVIDGDAGTVVALTGGAIGLVGLFRYLQ